jgi:hypothetical protein
MAAGERHWARDYGNGLLRELGADITLTERAEEHPGLRWARSGCMSLTGEPQGEPQMSPVPLAAYADGVLAALAALAPGADLAGLDGAALLGERAALAHHKRGGAVSAGGACRLLPAADGWLALNLPRVHDWELMSAWLECGPLENWAQVASALTAQNVERCIERGRLLGLALAAVAPPARVPRPWCRVFHHAMPAGRRNAAAPRVVDLSSLWAGPLCSHLLQRLGAEVVKVESRTRPDGLRTDGSGFFDLLNAGKASVALDLTQAAEREQLRRLLFSADIIIEGSRPRALRQLGIYAEEILARRRGVTWLAISGYGRTEPEAEWIALGDDAGVAAGLTHILAECSERMLFCADAIADPLTGLHAALVAWHSFKEGGGRGLTVALSDVVARGIAFAAPADGACWGARAAQWRSCVSPEDIRAPTARPVDASARALGADSAAHLGS